MSTATTNPPPTPMRGLPRLVQFTPGPTALPAPVIQPPEPAAEHPLTDRFHADACVVCTDSGAMPDTAVWFVDQVADGVAAEHRLTAELYDPQLTPGQKRVFDGERARLFRMLDARTPAKDAAVLELLDDMAEQAPAVDAVIAAEDERRRDSAAARPTVALALASNRRTS